MSQPDEQTTEPVAQPTPQPSPEPAAEPAPQPGWFKRTLHTLLSTETNAGRVMRPILRWVGATVGLTAFGALLVYLLLFLPLKNTLDQTRMQLAQSQKIIQMRDDSLKTLGAERDAVQKNLAQVQTDLAKAKAQNDLTLVLVEVNNARVALVNKDGAAAKTALDNALANLAKALPVVQQYDKALADVLKSRLELASKELVIDPQAAQSDLDKLQSDLVATLAKAFK